MSNVTMANSTVKTDNTKKLITAALFAALTYVGSTIIKIPTPTLGYVHPGDGFVLLAGLLLGPLWGGLAAGIGSALSDLLGGYFLYVPATFVIKALTAIVAFFAYNSLTKLFKSKTKLPQLILSGIAGELVMVLGYFFFAIFMLAVVNKTNLQAGVIAALSGIIPNIIQGVLGTVIATVLYPFIRKF